MCHAISSAIRPTASSTLCILLLVAAAAEARGKPGSVDDGAALWTEQLTAALSSCAADQCASADDATCASTCKVLPPDAPVCQPVDCASCIDDVSDCSGEEGCAERICVLCGWPDEAGELQGDCRASTPAASTGVTDTDVVPPAPWALYEVKDHHYHLLLAGNVRAPEPPTRAAKIEAARVAVTSLRERVGAMGILARIGAARSGDDAAVASLFSAGASVDDSVLASLAIPVERQLFIAIPERRPIAGSGSVTELGNLFTPGSHILPAYAKRVSVITARIGADVLIDREEPLDDEHAQRLLQRHKDAFRLCYENVLKSNRSLSGRIVMDLDVGVDGHVMGASTVHDDVASPALSRCVRGTLARIRFPAQPHDDVSLTASLSFQKRP